MVRYHESAQAELDAAVEYYAIRDTDLAARFHSELREVEALVADTPLSFPKFEQVGETAIRRALLEDFPFALLYVALPPVVWIVAVMHLRREPGYWRPRV